MKYLTYKEIDELRKNNKVIILRKNIVYDFTNFVKFHPCGKNLIINNIYKDNQKNYKFHNKNARNKWKKYKIGYIKEKYLCSIQ